MKKQYFVTFWAVTTFIFSIFSVTVFTKPRRSKPVKHQRFSGEGFLHTNLPPIALRAWQSTVQIRLERVSHWKKNSQRRNGPARIGSGIILAVDPGKNEALIVTTHHSVNPNRKLFRCEVRFPRQSQTISRIQRYYPARKVSIIMAKPGKDLVYLKVRYPRNAHPTPAVLKNIDNDLNPSGKLISIGYPNLGLRRKEGWNIPRPKNYKQVIKRFSMGRLLARGPTGNRVSILAHNADILKGNCGGPLVGGNGEVVGINAGFVAPNVKLSTDPSKYNYCPGDSKRYYIAISSSEILKDVQLIKNDRLW
ncbi:MAG: trypsin-like peptidase domain-containing protein [bacterium]|nr:trypsin-like peptidase domain-containing protein [bacterium]